MGQKCPHSIFRMRLKLHSCDHYYIAPARRHRPDRPRPSPLLPSTDDLFDSFASIAHCLGLAWTSLNLLVVGVEIAVRTSHKERLAVHLCGPDRKNYYSSHRQVCQDYCIIRSENQEAGQTDDSRLITVPGLAQWWAHPFQSALGRFFWGQVFYFSHMCGLVR